MTGEKIMRGQKDWRRVDVNDPIDVEYLHHQFPWLSHKQIRDAIKEHGPDRELIEGALEKAGSNDSRNER